MEGDSVMIHGICIYEAPVKPLVAFSMGEWTTDTTPHITMPLLRGVKRLVS